MSARATSRPSTLDLGLLLLRVALGGTLIAHGAQKLFVETLPGVTQAFAGMGKSSLRPPHLRLRKALTATLQEQPDRKTAPQPRSRSF